MAVPEPAVHQNTPSEVLEAGRGGLAFGLLATFTLMLYARPGDIYRPLANAHLAELSAMAAIGAYALSLFFDKPRFHRSRELIVIGALTFLFIAGVPQAFWRTGSLDVLKDTWMKTVMIFFLLTQTTTTVPRIRRLLWSIILCMFLVSAYTALNPSRSFVSEGRLTGATVGFLSGNYLGVAAGSMLPFIALFFMKTKSWMVKALLATTVLLLMWQVILTASRSNLMQVGLAMLLIWFLFMHRMKGAHLIAGVTAFALVTFLVAAPAVFWSRMQTLWSGEVEDYQMQSAKFSEIQRQNVFWRSIEFTLDNPLLGVGLGNFAIKSGNDSGRSSDWLGTHNTYTQISSEAGIPALLLYVSLVFGSVRGMMRVARATDGKPEFEEFFFLARATLAGLLVFAFAGFFAHLGYDYYFYYIVGVGVCVKDAYSRAIETPAVPAAAPLGKKLQPRWAR